MTRIRPSRGTVGSVAMTACLLAAAIFLAAAGTAPGADRYARSVESEDSLAAYWPMEGNLEDEAGEADGNLAGGEPAYVDGPAGKALLLGESRYVSMGSCTHLDLPQTTVEMLFKPTRKPEAPYNPCLIAKRESHRGTRFSLHLMRDLTHLAVWNGREVFRFETPLDSVRPGTWYHVAVSWKPGHLELYLNGVKCRGGQGDFNAELTGLPLLVGSSTPEGTELFHGAVDEIAIYDRALGADRIARHVKELGWQERMEKLRSEARAKRERERREARRRRQEKLQERLEAIERRMNDPELLAPGSTRVYRGEHLSAIQLPVGGIGAGVLHVNGKAQLNQWQIFNNQRPVEVPHTFFAVRARKGDEEPIVRALQTEPVGPFEPVPKLEFRGEHPFGWYDFQEEQLPVDVSMEVFNPLIPLNTKDSAIPCAVFTLRARNTADRDVEVTFLASQQNAVGLRQDAQVTGRKSGSYGGNVNTVRRERDARVLHMTASRPQEEPSYGDMALMTLDAPGTADPDWSTLEALHRDFEEDGRLEGEEQVGPAPDGTTLDGALTAHRTLKPGQERSVSFVLTWHFPNGRHGSRGWGGPGNQYSNWWSNAADVAQYVRANLDRLTRQTRLYHNTFYASNLPHWLLDRISSQVAVLRSKTCFWCRDGYFGGWEGCRPGAGCCAGNCAHVWHYAQAHARLFPDVGRRMREEALNYQRPDGAIPFRQIKGCGPALDGQCGEILGCYREYCTSSDDRWLDAHWPAIKKAMDYVIKRWDPDQDGILAGPQHNTLDGELSGSSSWLGSMYLAALDASRRMARLQGDSEAARRYGEIFQAGSRTQNRSLWNGEYYVQIPGEKRQEDYGSGCHIDQVLGQWWAHQMDLERIYPQDRVREALRSLLNYNFRPDFHGISQSPRKFVADDDAGTKMITWPHGDRPRRHTRYADEAMTGFEYAAAATMVQEGLLRRGFVMAKAISDRYDGRLRTGLTGGAWGYSGNPFGDDECGKYYARAMSVWSLLLACQGFTYEGPAGRLGFDPVWKPDDHRSFFTTAEGWGLFTHWRQGQVQTEHIQVKHGRLLVRELAFGLPQGAEPAAVNVALGERRLEAHVQKTPAGLTLELADPVILSSGSSLHVRVKTR